VSDEGNFFLPIPFGCRRDAEACARYLSEKIPSPENMTLDEFKEQFCAIAGSKQETVNHLVAMCCQW
jgi:hypothetical protein